MSFSFFDTLKYLINPFSKDKKGARLLISRERDMEAESLLQNYNKKNPTCKKVCQTNNAINLKFLPPLYLAINISLILLLLTLRYYKDIRYTSDISKGQFIFADYFDLHKVNSIIFRSYNINLSLLGVFLVTLVYSTLSRKLISRKMTSFVHYYKLYLMMFFGLLSNTFLLVISFTADINDYTFSRGFYFETDVRLSQFFFLVHTFFSILFFTYSLCSLLTVSQVNDSTRKKWVSFKFVILIYLSALTLLYVIILFFKSKLVSLNVNLDVNYNLALAVLPYFISILQSGFICTFYYEVRDQKMYIGSQTDSGGVENEKNTF